MLTKLVGAGVMAIAALAAIAGVYQITTRPPPAPVPAAHAAAVPAAATVAPRVITPAMLEADTEARRVIDQHRASLAGKVKCVGGVLFAIENDAWTNVGTC